MTTTAYKVYSNVEQETIYDRPIEIYHVDFYKAKNVLQDLCKKYHRQGLKIRYNEYQVKIYNEFIHYFIISDIYHGNDYTVYLEKIEIRG